MYARRAASPISRRRVAAAVIVVAVAALAVYRLALAPPQLSGDALTRLRTVGTVRIAVPDAAPQATASDGTRTGFDVDVATALAQELKLGVSIVPVAPGMPIPGDVGLSLGPAGDDQGAVTTDVPYAWWPTVLAVATGRAPITVDDLVGTRVCAPLESQAAAWADAWKMTVVEGDSDNACIDAMNAGRADALLTVGLFPSQLAGRGLTQVVLPKDVAPPPEPRVVRVSGPAADTATLVTAVQQAIDQLRTTGRLADLSRAGLGGQDITVQPN